MKKKPLHLVSFCLLLLVFPWMAPLQATSVRAVNLSEMVANSNRIFLGVCVSADSGQDADRHLSYTEYRFRVVDGFKGVTPGEIVTFRQFQGLGSALVKVIGMPVYQEGEKVLLFLSSDSKLGLTSPLGLQQGVFRPVGRDGVRGFVNGAANRNLAYELTESQAQQMDISRTELEALDSGRPLRLEQIRRLIEKIDRFHDNRARRVQ